MKVKWEKYCFKGVNNHDLCLLPLSIETGYYFLISKFSTTNIQYQLFLNENNFSHPKGKGWDGQSWSKDIFPFEDKNFNKPNQPVVCISYKDSLNYINWLNHKDNSIKYFLPNTALWEFATFGRIGDYQIINHIRLKEEAVFNSPLELNQNSQENLFGIVGLIGNIWEWVEPKNKNFLNPNENFPLPNDSNNTRNIILKLLMRNISHNIGSLERINNHYKNNKELRGSSFLDNPFETEPRMSSIFLDKGIKTRHSDLGFRVAGLLHKNELPKEIFKKIEEFTKRQIGEFKRKNLVLEKDVEKLDSKFYSILRMGKIEDAIEYLSSKSPKNRDLDKALSIIKYRLKTNQSEFNRGNITYEEKSVYELRILNSLIDIFENYA